MFDRLDAISDAQTTVSKHGRQITTELKLV